MKPHGIRTRNPTTSAEGAHENALSPIGGPLFGSADLRTSSDSNARWGKETGSRDQNTRIRPRKVACAPYVRVRILMKTGEIEPSGSFRPTSDPIPLHPRDWGGPTAHRGKRSCHGTSPAR